MQQMVTCCQDGCVRNLFHPLLRPIVASFMQCCSGLPPTEKQLDACADAMAKRGGPAGEAPLTSILEQFDIVSATEKLSAKQAQVERALTSMNAAMTGVMSGLSSKYQNASSMDDREEPVHSMQEAHERATALHAEISS
jgi:hypothetical protein